MKFSNKQSSIKKTIILAVNSNRELLLPELARADSALDDCTLCFQYAILLLLKPFMC